MTPADLKAARAILGLTQAALAQELGCTCSHVSHIEQGAVGASNALAKHIQLLVKLSARADSLHSS